jgi:hypothetical protein
MKKLVFIGSADSNHYRRWISSFKEYQFDITAINISPNNDWEEVGINHLNINISKMKILNFIAAYFIIEKK